MADDIHIYQIYYDGPSAERLDPGFIPLDNGSGEGSGWYEFWPILNFLRVNPLLDGDWYGFLSPRFTAKTGFDSAAVRGALRQAGDSADVAIFQTGWDQIAYFLNVFEQADFWHPGVSGIAQNFLDSQGVPIQLNRVVMHTENAVFSNYVIARPKFWRAWQQIAERFFEYVRQSPTDSPIHSMTAYGRTRSVDVKTFVQERFAPLILATSRLRVLTVDATDNQKINTGLFGSATSTRRSLQVLDFMKQQYTRSGDADYLAMYRKVRRGIKLRLPPHGTA